MFDWECCRGYLFVEFDCRGHGTPTGELAELIETVKHRTVLTDVEPLEQLAVLAHVVRADGPEEPDVVVTVELGHLVLRNIN